MQGQAGKNFIKNQNMILIASSPGVKDYWLEVSRSIILPISSKRMVPPCSGGEVETSTEQISDEKTVSLTGWTVSRAGCSQPSVPIINHQISLCS